MVHERLSSLIWKCLDNDLNKTAHFYAERLFAFDGSNHEARHLLATATLRLNQPHSALHLVTRPRDDQCAGCYEIAAKCSAALGRHSKARSLLEYSIVLSTTSPISTSIIVSINSFRVAHPPLLPLSPSLQPSTEPRTTRVASTVQDAASLHCHSGILAAKACLTSEAIASFTRALQLEPLLWEAWTGLCALGASTQPPLAIASFILYLICMPRSTGAKVDVNAHLPIPPHLRDVHSIFLEESPTSGIYGTDLRARDQTPSSSAPRTTGLGFFTPDAADPSTRNRAQQQNIRSMLGSKDVLTRKPQSVPRLLHKPLCLPLHQDKKA